MSRTRRTDGSRRENCSDGTAKRSRDGRRTANLYDAAAGRIDTNGFIKEHIYGRNDSILAPEEVLFKAKYAPERFQEDDFYSADRDLSPRMLPDSDLLKEVHAFTADFYEHTTSNQNQVDKESMDGSALLALGILLQETAGSILGHAGDMAFVEGLRLEKDGFETSATESDAQPIHPNSAGSIIRVKRAPSRRPVKRRKK